MKHPICGCPFLRGANFNLRYGRRPKQILREIIELIERYNLDFVVVQEARDYIGVLTTVPGYTYYTDTTRPGGIQVGILVRDERSVTRVLFTSLGDGWNTIFGGRHAPLAFPRLTIDGWCRVGGLHLPTPSTFNYPGRVWLPRERIDDFYDGIKKVYYFLRFPSTMRRVVCADWNEPASTRSKDSPAWFVLKAKGKIWSPKPSQRRGGSIDWIATKRGFIPWVEEAGDISERSDHEPVVFEFHKRGRKYH